MLSRIGRSVRFCSVCSKVKQKEPKMSIADKERESFVIFDSITAKKNSQLQNICDEILTLTLTEVSELSRALNDPKIVGEVSLEFPSQNEVPLPKNRSPFPNPKHLFAGVDADNRPGMHTAFSK